MGGRKAMLRLSRALRFAAPEGVTNRLLLTLGSPAESIYKNKPVDSVTIPGAEGDMTLGNNHSQVVSMLKPGVITVREGGNKEDFFVSDGWAFMSAPKDTEWDKAKVSLGTTLCNAIIRAAQ